MADETYYSILEIQETATAKEIKTAYYRVIREVHPDTVANAPAYWQRKAEEKSKEVNEAYAVFSDQEKRRSYDAQLSSYRGRTTASASYSSTPASSSNSAQGQTTYRATRRSTRTSSRSSSRAPGPRINWTARLYLTFFLGSFGVFAAAVFRDVTSIGGEAIAWFLAAVALWYGVIYLYRHWLSRLFLALGVSRPKHQFWITIGILITTLCTVRVLHKAPNENLRSQEDQPATRSQISQVEIVDGSLSVMPVSGNSNEKYASASQFTASVQNNSDVHVSSVRIKVRLFDCPGVGNPPHVEGGVIFQSGTFDPSPPATCSKVGQQEEKVFIHADPGQTIQFANFYFPDRPQNSWRWNYDITAMDVEKIKTVLSPVTSGNN